MTRQELYNALKRYTAEILQKFQEKNRSYGKDDDAFYNFRQIARHIWNSQNPCDIFRVLLILMDKHFCALAQNSLQDKEVRERLMDMAVYSLIALAMEETFNKTGRV